jgi:hypothetical protein
MDVKSIEEPMASHGMPSGLTVGVGVGVAGISVGVELG